MFPPPFKIIIIILFYVVSLISLFDSESYETFWQSVLEITFSLVTIITIVGLVLMTRWGFYLAIANEVITLGILFFAGYLMLDGSFMGVSLTPPEVASGIGLLCLISLFNIIFIRWLLDYRKDFI